jgi:hypothetical protein
MRQSIARTRVYSIVEKGCAEGYEEKECGRLMLRCRFTCDRGRFSHDADDFGQYDEAPWLCVGWDMRKTPFTR